MKEVKKPSDILDKSYESLSNIYYTIRISIACWSSRLKSLDIIPRLAQDDCPKAKVRPAARNDYLLNIFWV